MRRLLLLTLTLLLLTLDPMPAAADPGGPDGPGGPGGPGGPEAWNGRFRRTSPRGSLDRDAGGLAIGIPAGRAWGVESALHPIVGGTGMRLTMDLAVDDPDVAEAFVRVAYYGRADQRSRQLETVDSPFVRVGPERRVSVELEPPAGAVAYRVRVLGRLAGGSLVSRADAIRARWLDQAGEQGPWRTPRTRLLSDLP